MLDALIRIAFSKWKIPCKKSEKAGERWPDSKQREEFLDGIKVDKTNEIHGMKVRYIQDGEKDGITFVKMTEELEKAARRLYTDGKESRVRRGNISNNKQGGNSGSHLEELHIPDHVLTSIREVVDDKAKTSKVIGIILNWKKFLNEKQRQPTKADMETMRTNSVNSRKSGNKRGQPSRSNNNNNSKYGNGKDSKKARTNAVGKPDKKTEKSGDERDLPTDSEGSDE